MKSEFQQYFCSILCLLKYSHKCSQWVKVRGTYHHHHLMSPVDTTAVDIFVPLTLDLWKKNSFPRQQLFLYIASSIHQQIKRALRSSSKDVTENFSLLKRRVYSLSPHYFTNNLMQGSFQKNLWPPTFFRSFLPHTQKNCTARSKIYTQQATYCYTGKDIPNLHILIHSKVPCKISNFFKRSFFKWC